MPLKGRWEPSVNAVPTELVSLRDKVSVVVVAPYGAVVPAGHPPSVYRLCKSAPVANSPVRGQSSVEGKRRQYPRPDRDESSVERGTSRFPVNVPSGTKQKTKNNYHTNKSNHYEINEKQHLHANPHTIGFCGSKQTIHDSRILARTVSKITFHRHSQVYGISMGIACLIYGDPMGRKLHLRDVTDFDAVALVYNLCRYEQVMRPKMN